jgi:hypothetical protein
MDVPFEFLSFAGCHNGIRIGRRGRLTRGAHNHARRFDEQAAIFPFHVIAQDHLDAFALIRPED